MAVDIDYITDEYFAFDKPVPYQLSAGKIIELKPFMITQTKQFEQVQTFFSQDKRDEDETKDKTELQFVIEDLLSNQGFIFLLTMILGNIGYMYPFFGKVDGEYILGTYTKESEDSEMILDEQSIITSEEWEDIKKIIMYQNDPDYDDTLYIDKTIRKNLQIESEIKNKGTVAPNLERQFYMITAHCGMPKSEQIKLTLRGFKKLFTEVTSEAEFYASYALRSKYAEKGKPAEHWVWQQKKDGMEKIGTAASSFLQSLGMDEKEVFKDLYAQETSDGFKNEVSQDEIEEIRRKIASGEI